MEKINRLWYLFLIGLILRLFIAAFTFHPDVRTPALSSAVLFQRTSLNFYEVAPKISNQDILDDLPLSYFISLPGHMIGRILVDQKTEDLFLRSQGVLFGNPSLWLYLVYVKLPFIIFDLLIAFLLLQIVNFADRKKVTVLWIFNPVSLWVSSGIGQADVYATFFIVLTLLLIKKSRLDLGALSLGLGGAIKSAPILLLPYLLGMATSWGQRLKLTALALVPFLITVIPYLNSPEFRTRALFAPQLDKSLYASLPLSSSENILIVPIIILGLYFIFFFKKRQYRDFLNFSLISLTAVLAFTHFHIQWFLWITPLLILWFVGEQNRNKLLPILGLLLGLLIMFFSFDGSLQLKLFAPLWPGLDKVNGLAEILSADKLQLVRSFAATIFAASALSLSWRTLKNS
ncbi:MAG: hypothetical protein HYW45_00680 [Candidatus Daviesbacteria bacterium]|nr:MAG: hypothetical protein HYW45_00680 [Candidatus Daviesbacteria bacterium]